MLPYAAYLRVYEPLSAFSDAERQRWAAYAGSPDRPRRSGTLEAEQAEALGRLVALPPIPAPASESGHAYVRRAEGITYVCPWQIRLRSWLALSRLRSESGPLLRAAFGAAQAEAAARDFARWQDRSASLRLHIQTCTWSVPASWFVPFAQEERWLVLGPSGDQETRGPATASVTRTLIYATAMAQARRRVARALSAIRRAKRGRAGSGSAIAATRRGRERPAGGTGSELEEVGRWLEEFHPHSLVELDYGGLVHLLDDDALRADQSVAEVAAAVSALASGEDELAAATYKQLQARWRVLEARETAS